MCEQQQPESAHLECLCYDIQAGERDKKQRKINDKKNVTICVCSARVKSLSIHVTFGTNKQFT